MLRGKPGHGSQGSEANFLAEIRFDVVADAARKSWWQSATAGCWRLGYRQSAKSANSCPGVGNCFPPATRYPRSVERRRKQHAPPPPLNTTAELSFMREDH